MTSVYVMKSPLGGVKIGISGKPSERIKTISRATGLSLKLVHDREIENARMVERVAHHLLREKRSCGEWFGVSDQEAVEAIAEAVRMVEEGFSFDLPRARRGDQPLDRAILIKFTVDQIARLDAWRAAQPMPIKRAEAIRMAIRKFIAAPRANTGDSQRG